MSPVTYFRNKYNFTGDFLQDHIDVHAELFVHEDTENDWYDIVGAHPEIDRIVPNVTNPKKLRKLHTSISNKANRLQGRDIAGEMQHYWDNGRQYTVNYIYSVSEDVYYPVLEYRRHQHSHYVITLIGDKLHAIDIPAGPHAAIYNFTLHISHNMEMKSYSDK